ncbi:DHA2 family efflux MFS transporter permease subunit [Acidiferrimicrobium sp. IK]|uniref:DHA2 family efflux MFS transporter permease subunit n=1 Tax=Acidiferrimicrobium sp. IK TaxID=2871700 RepID=UPI0021CB1BBE|nr:DHA2 family efflux MFS transporter permease subunit [Acidiferrimicrobium sp. IK]MCU4185897.1 DHA2 family efflux MFS transporter permease subunit [Acidiferrimicrobium sp. IK]
MTSNNVLPDVGPARGTSASKDHHARRWWILAALTLAQLMVVLDATVVNIALPSAQHALRFSTADRQWIVTAYSLAFGSLLLLGGRLSDLLGARRVLIAGMIGFAAASALGGAATGFPMLVVARAVQGAFGALLAPAALSQLTTTFSDPAERGKAFGIFGAVAGAGGAVGLILGGALTQYLDWRWCLYINDVLVVFALAGAMTFLPRSERARNVRLDWPGVGTVVAGLVGIVYGFSEAEHRGWADPITIGLLLAGVVLLGAFAAIERRSAHPLLPLRVLADRNRGTANLVILVSGIGMFGVFLFLTYYIQLVLGFSPLMSGVAFLPMIGALMITSTVATAKLLPRTGPRPLVSAGMAIAAAGLVVFAQLGVSSTYGALVVPGLILAGAGLGLVFGAAMNVATSGSGSEDAGVASALPNIGQQVGGSIGTALLNTLAASAATSYIHQHGPSLASQAAASVRGDDVAFWVAAGVFAAGAVLSALLFERGPMAMDPHAAPAMI